MKPSDIKCPWCEEHTLRAEWEGNEVYLRCAQPGDFDCPDTAGLCKTLDEAINIAIAMNENKLPDNDQVQP